MDKKDIYEHLANIYLDASSKRRKKIRKHKSAKNIFLIASFFVLGFFVIIWFLPHSKHSSKKLNYPSEVALILQNGIVKINFNFDSVKKEAYSMNLNNLDLRQFKVIGFSARKANFDDKITLRVEFANAEKENSEFYISDLKAFRWQDYKISLSSFKHIANWSEMSRLSFIIEEDTTKEKSGIVYIDDVRFLR